VRVLLFSATSESPRGAWGKLPCSLLLAVVVMFALLESVRSALMANMTEATMVCVTIVPMGCTTAA
jgi:hypothetical protein